MCTVGRVVRSRQAKGCPVRGPLGRAIGTFDQDFETKFGNGLIFAFAGHDTTGA